MKGVPSCYLVTYKIIEDGKILYFGGLAFGLLLRCPDSGGRAGRKVDDV